MWINFPAAATAAAAAEAAAEAAEAAAAGHHTREPCAPAGYLRLFRTSSHLYRFIFDDVEGQAVVAAFYVWQQHSRQQRSSITGTTAARFSVACSKFKYIDRACSVRTLLPQQSAHFFRFLLTLEGKEQEHLPNFMNSSSISVRDVAGTIPLTKSVFVVMVSFVKAAQRSVRHSCKVIDLVLLSLPVARCKKKHAKGVSGSGICIYHPWFCEIFSFFHKTCCCSCCTRYLLPILLLAVHLFSLVSRQSETQTSTGQ